MVTVVEFEEEIKEKSGFEELANPLTPKSLDNYKYKDYINFSIREAGLEELADSPVSKTGGSQALWVRNSSEFPHPARNSDSNNKFSIKKVKIKDIKAGQYVLSLNEATGKLEPAKVNALLDHGIKPIYEMATEDGRAINTTAEHPYLAKLYDKELCDKYAGNVWNKNIDENEFEQKSY